MLCVVACCQHGVQTLANVGPNNVASCWPTMLRAFARALSFSGVK